MWLFYVFTVIPTAFTQFINTVRLPFRPIYISKHIQPEHVNAIHNAVNEYNKYTWLWEDEFVETTDKSTNHIRIQYDTYNGCSMSAVTASEGYFQVTDTTITFEPMLDPIMTQCVILHELGHSLGLRNDTTSIMQPTIQLRNDQCTLEINDIVHLYILQQ